MPKGTIIETKDKVNTNRAGVYDVTLLVKYPNGDVKEVAIKVTVKQKDQNNGVNTGDSSEVLLYGGLLAMMSTSILLMIRKKQSR